MENSFSFNVKLHKYARTDMYIRVYNDVDVIISNFVDAAGNNITDLSTLDLSESSKFDMSLTPPTNANDVLVYQGKFDDALEPDGVNRVARWLRIKANRYCEFTIEIAKKSRIRYINTPSFFSEWNLSMFDSSFTGLHQLYICGRVTGNTSSLLNCPTLKYLSIMTHTVEFSPANLGNVEIFFITPHEFDYPKNVSPVFDVADVVTANNIAHLKKFLLGGISSVPLNGITGHLQSLTGLTLLETLHITYTKVYPENANKDDYFSGWTNLTSFTYSHNSPNLITGSQS
jgi:hypothetical protein